MLLLDQLANSIGRICELTEADYHLNVALVYQDATTHQRAQEVRDLMAEKAGEGVVQSTEWLCSFPLRIRHYFLAPRALDLLPLAVLESKTDSMRAM